MAHLFRTLAVLPMVHVVNSAWICPTGWRTQSEGPKCEGAVDSTCSTELCCSPVPTCFDYKALSSWGIEASGSYRGWPGQPTGGGCEAETKFFDPKKAGVEVADPQGDAEVKAACCTPFADAQCSDWLMGCPSNKKKSLGTKSAAADRGNGTGFRITSYNNLCCEKIPITCSDYSQDFLLNQSQGGGCAPDTMFFDHKKADVEVAAPQGFLDVKDACCTPFADARCSDWTYIAYKECPAGKSGKMTNSAPANQGNGMGINHANYTQWCCAMTCKDFSHEWGLAQGLGEGCAADTKFFDLKKADVEVADPQGDAEVKAACCTPFADTKCSDWRMGCPSAPIATYLIATNSAPPDSRDGKLISDDKYRKSCCAVEMKCADHGGETNSVSQAAASLVVLVLAITAVMAHAL